MAHINRTPFSHAATITHVLFSSGARVAIEDAAEHYDRGGGSVVQVAIVDDTGREHLAWAKQWSVWCEPLGRHVLARIGVGAYGNTVCVWRTNAELSQLAGCRVGY